MITAPISSSSVKPPGPSCEAGMVAAEDGDGAAIDAPAHEAKTLASSNKIPSFRVMPTLISTQKGGEAFRL